MATVNDKVQLQKVETWFDPLEMFRQIAPHGIVNKVVKGADEVGGPGEHLKDLEEEEKPGNALAVPQSSEETQVTHEEMSHITKAECPFFNQE